MKTLGIVLLISFLAIPALAQAAPDPLAGLINVAPVVVDQRKPSWTERRIFKFAAITALHAAGAFDAYQTNQLIGSMPPTVVFRQGGGTLAQTFYSHEDNPLLKPFAGNWSMYPAIQVGDGLLSTWLLRAKSPRSRRAAWVAVGVQIGLHIGLGLNNYRQHEAMWSLYRQDRSVANPVPMMRR